MNIFVFRFLPVTLILGTLAVAGWIFWGLSQQPEAPVASSSSPSAPLSIKGLAYSNYEGDQLLSRVEANRLQVRPRKFFVFNIKSVNEVILEQGRFEIHMVENQEAGKGERFSLGAELSTSVNGLAGLKGMGRITRCLVGGMAMDIFLAGKPHFLVKAEKAFMDFQKKETRFENVLLEGGASEKKIWAEQVWWDEGQQIFRIPGKYKARTPRGNASGEGILIDLDFRVRKLASKCYNLYNSKDIGVVNAKFLVFRGIL